MDLMKLNDYNAENVSLSQVSTRQGKRWSTASAYLLKAVKRENLDILTHVHCCRVVFDEEKQVHGVVTKRSSSLDKEEFIKGKEVVLSAGTVGSAQILLLSGIGPRKELDKHEIPVIVDLSGVVYHPIGTCKMGKEDHPTAVVTPDTRVKGIKGLRVVDASIMPSHISGNINIPIVALAERAADLIKNSA
ncbi:unnamed protein product [Rotaria sp. Silwood1]|nr:unnamed protein product [Rotaria sp. Silwood1]CAF1571023.1 unnamed protein product [Rotaria sp. Silwood1]CAF3684293.1 unnamed protein product [Rotaria sp. Silwood1]CAF3708342.1 unnamed protein product [Rotaria sp. Silwood1]CAF4806687.1 unnamed protein product [Rotaria sp. Silwood1]